MEGNLGKWKAFGPFFKVAWSFLLAAIFVSAERRLKQEQEEPFPRNATGISGPGSDLGFLSDFIWQAENSGYEHVWPDLEFNWQIVIGSIVGFFGAAFGSIGGVGGGGIFVPMLTLIIGFDPKSATAISKCMIMGAAVSTVYYNLRLRHPTIDTPIIDYDLAVLIQPMLMLGISIGVTFNVVFADWMVTVLLIILCIVTSTKAFFKGVETWKKETMLKEEAAKQLGDDSRDEAEYKLLPGGPSKSKDANDSEEPKVGIIENVCWKEFGFLVFVWFAYLVLQIIKNDAATCSAIYWVVNLLQIPVSVGVSGYEALSLYKGWRKIGSKGEEGADFKVHQLIIYASFGVLAGIVAGLLGVGGGSIMGPLFLELGAPPQVASATATFAMMFSSSMSVIEYYLLKRFPLPYALYLVGVAIVAAFIGQHVMKKIMILLGRTSIIIFILSFTIFVSAICLGPRVSTIRGLEDSFIYILRRCDKTAEVKTIHSQMEKFSLMQSNFLVTRMLDICDQNGDIEYATLLFQNVLEPNIFLYNAMIRAYTHNDMHMSAFDVYKKMLRHHLQAEEQIFPDRFTYPFVIRSCGSLASVCTGKQVQGHVCKFGLTCNKMVESSLLDMYVKCDEIGDAHRLFDEMSERDVISWNCLISGYTKLGQVKKARSLFDKMPNKTIVSWTVMISGYTKIGLFDEALNTFRKMQVDGLQPDWISLVSVLPACAQSGSLELGKWIHSYAGRKGQMKRISVCNALIEMYTKCGLMGPALQIFSDMPERDVISWSTMIAGLAHHGQAHEVIKLFSNMQRAGIGPNEVTFVGLLSACAHAGLLEDGLRYFESMQSVYNIEPGIEHYGCMVDLLGRTGHIDRALKLIKSMRSKPDSAIWGSLLSSCRTYRDLETAVFALEKLLELEPKDTGNLVLLANIYADLGKWKEVSRMRKFMRIRCMRKTPGCSSIEVDGVVREFVAGDDSKPFGEEVFGILEVLVMHEVERDDWVEFELDCM